LTLSCNGEELAHAVRHGVRVLDVQTEGKVEKALIKELQWDHLGKEILHVDFARVAADERVEINVRVELRGTAIESRPAALSISRSTCWRWNAWPSLYLIPFAFP